MSTAHTLLCNVGSVHTLSYVAHTCKIHAHNSLCHVTPSSMQAHMFKCIQFTHLCVDTHAYTHTHTPLTCTHGCLRPHRPTSHTPTCLLKIHTSTQTEDTEGQDPHPATPMATSEDTQTHTQLMSAHTEIGRDPHSISCMDGSHSHHTHRERHMESHTGHAYIGLDTQRGTRTHTDTRTHTHTYTQSQAPALTSPKSSQPSTCPHTHPGQLLPPLRSRPRLLEVSRHSPALRARQQHHRQIKSECAKIKAKGCDKAVPFPQDSELTQVLLCNKHFHSNFKRH